MIKDPHKYYQVFHRTNQKDIKLQGKKSSFSNHMIMRLQVIILLFLYSENNVTPVEPTRKMIQVCFKPQKKAKTANGRISNERNKAVQTEPNSKYNVMKVIIFA